MLVRRSSSTKTTNFHMPIFISFSCERDRTPVVTFVSCKVSKSCVNNITFVLYQCTATHALSQNESTSDPAGNEAMKVVSFSNFL